MTGGAEPAVSLGRTDRRFAFSSFEETLVSSLQLELSNVSHAIPLVSSRTSTL